MAKGDKGDKTRSNPGAQKLPFHIWLNQAFLARMLTKQITLKVMLADTKSVPPNINFLASAFHSYVHTAAACREALITRVFLHVCDFWMIPAIFQMSQKRVHSRTGGGGLRFCCLLRPLWCENADASMASSPARAAHHIATRVLLLLIPFASLCPHIRTCNIGGHVDAINKTQNKNT